MKLKFVAREIPTGKVVAISDRKGLAVAKAAKSDSMDLVIETVENGIITERHYWLRRNDWRGRRHGVSFGDVIAKSLNAMYGDDLVSKVAHCRKYFPGYEWAASIR